MKYLRLTASHTQLYHPSQSRCDSSPTGRAIALPKAYLTYSLIFSLLPSASQPPSSSEEGKTWLHLKRELSAGRAIALPNGIELSFTFPKEIFHFCGAKISSVRRTDFTQIFDLDFIFNTNRKTKAEFIKI